MTDSAYLVNELAARFSLESFRGARTMLECDFFDDYLMFPDFVETNRLDEILKSVSLKSRWKDEEKVAVVAALRTRSRVLGCDGVGEGLDYHDRHWFGIGHLDPEAFSFYLSCFMSSFLRGRSESVIDSPALSSWIRHMSVVDVSTYEIDAYYYEKYSKFSSAQIEVVAMFVNYLFDHRVILCLADDSPIFVARAAYWEQFLV